jgi:hypothetical protein
MNKSRVKIILIPLLVITITAVACNALTFKLPGSQGTATPTMTVRATTTPLSLKPATLAALTQTPGETPNKPHTLFMPLLAYPHVVPTATAAPTQTPKPTPTPIPTVSYVGPGQRSGVSIIAAHLNHEINIDGSPDDWNLDKVRLEKVVYGTNSWAGTADLSARAMVGWDQNYLYINARIFDDRYVQNNTGKNIYRGDSLQIMLDTNVSADFYQSALNGDDFQVAISPGSPQPGDSPEAYLAYPAARDGALKKSKVGAIPLSDGYRVEAALPWGAFGVSPHAGQHFGLAISVSDNDAPNKNIQQSIVSSISALDPANPTGWGDFMLSAATPPSRPKAGISASYAARPPVLNADLSDWDTHSYPVSQVVYSSSPWNGVGDISGDVMMQWDSLNLYLGAVVVDDRFVQNTNGKNIFLGDSLEILLDTNLIGDYDLAALNSDDYQLGLSPGNPDPGTNPQAYLWFPQSIAGQREQVMITSKATSDGYIVEAAVPWSVFNLSPSGNERLGCVFSVSDNDSPDKNVQQILISNQSGRELSDPATGGVLTLVNASN